MSDIYDTIIIALRVEMSTIYDIIFQRNKKTIISYRFRFYDPFFQESFSSQRGYNRPECRLIR